MGSSNSKSKQEELLRQIEIRTNGEDTITNPPTNLQEWKQQLLKSLQDCHKQIDSQLFIKAHKEKLKEETSLIVNQLTKYLDKPNVVFIGPVQTGKTSLFNVVTGSNAQVGQGIRATTLSNSAIEIDGVVYWDTPGFGDSVNSELGKEVERLFRVIVPDLVICMIKCADLTKPTAVYTLKFVDELLKKKQAEHEHCSVLFVLSHKDQVMETDIPSILKDQLIPKYISKERLHDNYKIVVGGKLPVKPGAPTLNFGALDYPEIASEIAVQINEFRTNRIKSLEKVRIAACHKLIWSFAGMAAAFGIIPGVDIAMAIILNNNLSILLKAAWGSGTRSVTPEAVSGVLNGLVMLGRGGYVVARLVFGVGQIVSKAFDATIIGLAIGQGISVGLNFGYTIAHGYIAWKLLADETNRDT